MSQQPLGILIPFAGMGLVPGKTETVIEALGFFAGFFNKLLAQRLDRLECAVMNLLSSGSSLSTDGYGCMRFLRDLPLPKNRKRSLSHCPN
jgi:hypothetical protein